MGIPGVLKEIGRGDRVALARLAIEHLERTQRPLRIAIDAAIWNFQTQAGQGGKNPALRTLYYRLLRLLALPIHPLFVYDGKNKPLSKRGQTVSRYGTCLANETSKKLLEQFRFPHHTAPGEAEAECAQLQRQGLVDMVMSQDGDAIMFGSNLTLRNWSKEGARGNKEPTHIDLLDLKKIKDGPGLDPAGMILVALLSGGDYNQQGLPGFGVHVACDIARAGFGPDLLEAVKNSDEDALRDWRERLEYELETNESGYFKKRHKTLKIPTKFPDQTILSYYTDPAVSTTETLRILAKKWQMDWKAEIDIASLRAYTGDTFDWQYKPGAWKLVRTLARPLLAHRLQNGLADRLVNAVSQFHERREHYTTGGIPELRLSVVPADIVGLDLEAEPDSPEYLASLEAEQEVDEEFNEVNEDEPSGTQSPSKPKKAVWSPYVPEKMWLPETLVELGAPVLREEWNQIQRDKLEKRAKPTRKSKPVKPAKEVDRIDRYFAISRPAESQPVPQIFKSTPSTPQKKAAPSRTLSEISPDLKQYFKPTRLPTLEPLRSVKHPRPSPSPSPSRQDLLVSTTATLSETTNVTVAAEDNTSSMLTPTTTRQATLVETSPTVRDLENSVTQRRTRRVRNKLERSKTEGAQPSEESIPLDLLLQQSPTGSTKDQSTQHTVTSTALPKVLGTGLKIDFQRGKVLAAPRESLEGTWKEVDLDEEIISSKTRRQPRVSYIDLTND